MKVRDHLRMPAEDEELLLGDPLLTDIPGLTMIPKEGVWMRVGDEFLIQGLDRNVAHIASQDPDFLEARQALQGALTPMMYQLARSAMEQSPDRILVTGAIVERRAPDMAARTGEPVGAADGYSMPLETSTGVRMTALVAMTGRQPARILAHELFHLHLREGRIFDGEFDRFRDPGFIRWASQRYQLDTLYADFLGPDGRPGHFFVEEAAAAFVEEWVALRLADRLAAPSCGDHATAEHHTSASTARRGSARLALRELQSAAEAFPGVIGFAERFWEGEIGRREADPAVAAGWIAAIVGEVAADRYSMTPPVPLPVQRKPEVIPEPAARRGLAGGLADLAAGIRDRLQGRRPEPGRAPDPAPAGGMDEEFDPGPA